MNRRSFLRLGLTAIVTTVIGKAISEPKVITSVIAENPVLDNPGIAENLTQSMLSSKHMLQGDFDSDVISYPSDMDAITYNAFNDTIEGALTKRKEFKKKMFELKVAGENERAELYYEAQFRIKYMINTLHPVQASNPMFNPSKFYKV